MDIAFGILFVAVVCAEIMLLPVSAAAITYFRYNATSGCVGDNVVEPGDIENMDACLAEIVLLRFGRPPYLFSV